MQRWWLLLLLAACNTTPDTCKPCDFSPNSCGAGEQCVGDPELAIGTCTSSDVSACEAALAPQDDKADGSSLSHQLIGRGTGHVLHSMKLWTIAWHVDAALAADVDTFHQWMLQSGYWKSSLVEYNVGAGRSMGVIEVAGDVPAVFDEALADNVIYQLIATGQLPVPDEETAYSFIVPAATGTPPDTGGYHSVLPSLHVPYEAMTRMLSADGTVDFDQLTYSYAHETAELATDPFGDSWGGALFFREIGDMCNNLSRQTALVTPPSGGTPRSYKVSRLFSNRRSAAGLDPCVPVRAGSEYRGVAVTPTDAVVALGPSGNGTTTMTLRAFSSNPDAKTVQWRAEFVNQDPNVQVRPDHGVATIGSPVTITVTAKNAHPPSYGIGLDFLTIVPDPTNTAWNAGEVSQWNTLLEVR